MIQFYKNNKFLLLGYFILFLSFLTSYSLFDDSKFKLVFNSDTFGSYYIFQDVFINHGDIKGWYFASAPTVFPDLLLYFLIIYIFKASVLTATFIYSALQLTIITSLLVYIYKKSVQADFKKYAWVIPVFFSMFYLESFYFSHDFSFAFLLTQPSYHAGAFLNTLIMVAIYLSSIKKYYKYVLFFFLTVIFSFSDRLFLVMFVAPFILTLIFTLRRERIKQNLIYMVCIIAGTVSAIWLFEYIRDNKFLIFTEPHKLYAFDFIVPSLKLFTRQLANYIKIPGFRSFVIIFTVSAFVGSVIFCIRNRKTMTPNLLFINIFFVVFTFCVAAAPIINGNYSGYDTLRYNIHIFYFSALILTLVLAVSFEKNNFQKFSRFIPLTIILIFCIMSLGKISPWGLKNFFTYYPDDVREIDSVCVKYNLKRGIAEYWTAKRSSLLSRHNIQVLSAFSEGNLYEFGSNLNWFYEGDFDFVISNTFLPGAMKKNFVIKDTVKTVRYEFLIVEKFYYPKGEYFPKVKPNN